MTELVLTRHFAAPRTAVWAAFCEPEIIAQWWGPAEWGIKESSVVLEPRVGGRHELVMYQHQDPTQEVPLKARSPNSMSTPAWSAPTDRMK
ncbi:SRPBCC domain-containing protein [Arthrobacter sp. JCM 19049]|uniref:SRPBCC family protein n=1 Tax=Arthrobacter sp. JCM 19049 TaxID=1460643 RepID=UPI0006D03990|nr:SRPBCC domain-containing protein [Arthrobacter sp. JCM 19049]